MAFYRLLFFAESPTTPWPTNAGEFTAFCAEYATIRCLDLTLPPLSADRVAWTHVTDYAACHDLADIARTQDVHVIKYESVRDPHRGRNVAILSCRAFTQNEPIARQTWRIFLDANGSRVLCEFPKLNLHFGRAAFAADPRIGAMTWER